MKIEVSLTGSSVLGGGCLGIPILAPMALEREEVKRLANGLVEVAGWFAPRSRRRQVDEEEESYDHAQHRRKGEEVAVIASSRRRPAHQTRHVHQHPPLTPPLFSSLCPSNRSRWSILLLGSVA